MKKIGIVLLLAMFSLLHFRCGYSGCGGPSYYEYNPSPGVQISLDKNYLYDNLMIIKLIDPKVYYPIESKTALPLLANYNRMVFEISKNDTVLDSLIINYKMTAVYVSADECNGERYKPFVELKPSYSTTNYFKFGCRAINGYY
ncbi:MAG: hypothetical protein WCI53_04085 [Bacteroidota bacterium]